MNTENPAPVPSLSSFVVASAVPPFSPPAPLKPEDLMSFRATDDDSMCESVPVKRVPKVGKPSKQTWFRTYPDESKWYGFNLYTPEEGIVERPYLVAPSVAQEIGSVASHRRLIPCMDRQERLFFWPLNISSHSNTWTDSARQIAGEAMVTWCRMQPDHIEKRYSHQRSRSGHSDPTWPSDEQIEELLCAAFEGFVIQSVDHPEIVKLLQ